MKISFKLLCSYEKNIYNTEQFAQIRTKNIKLSRRNEKYFYYFMKKIPKNMKKYEKNFISLLTKE